MKMKFEWDYNKAKINEKKHGISFAEAAYVFADKNNITLFDSAHSGPEERWVTIGRIQKKVIVVVCHTYRGTNDQNMRIFSARRATKREKKLYLDYN